MTYLSWSIFSFGIWEFARGQRRQLYVRGRQQRTVAAEHQLAAESVGSGRAWREHPAADTSPFRRFPRVWITDFEQQVFCYSTQSVVRTQR